jgi:DNA anti-recombination protein RmuC
MQHLDNTLATRVMHACNIVVTSISTFATTVWNMKKKLRNTQKQYPQHLKTTSATFKNTSATSHKFETSKSTFATSTQNTSNIFLKHLKPVEHMLAT